MTFVYKLQKIKTFTKGTNPEASDIVEIRNQVASVDTLVFLGFAYHTQNLELLQLPPDLKNSRKRILCYGTTVDISEADLKVITSELEKIHNAILISNEDRNLKCRDLFNTYKRALSFV